VSVGPIARIVGVGQQLVTAGAAKLAKGSDGAWAPVTGAGVVLAPLATDAPPTTRIDDAVICAPPAATNAEPSELTPMPPLFNDTWAPLAAVKAWLACGSNTPTHTWQDCASAVPERRSEMIGNITTASNLEPERLIYSSPEHLTPV
jgi:hypothetical protein